jgi:hypothetical protein
VGLFWALHSQNILIGFRNARFTVSKRLSGLVSVPNGGRKRNLVVIERILGAVLVGISVTFVYAAVVVLFALYTEYRYRSKH